MDIKRKITARTMGIESGIKGIGQSFTVIGVVTAYQSGETEYGPYVKFRGRFEATNDDNGVQGRSTVFIAPGHMLEEDLLLGVRDHGSVEFAARYSLQEGDNPMGVEWVVEPLIQPDNDPLDALRNQIKLLEKPKGK